MFAGEAAVFVAEHEHVKSCGGRVVHEVVGRVGFVVWCGHEEGGGCAEGDDGVGGAEGESEDS